MIKRLPKSTDTDEMPAARIYLDEIKEIVDILSSPDSTGGSEAPVVKYRVRDVECDTLEELEQLGGRARRFEIRVTRGHSESTLRFKGYSTHLRLFVPESDYWSRHGKVRRISESNAILWKNIANKCLDHLWFVIAVPVILLILHLVTYQFTASTALKKTNEELYWVGTVTWVVFLFVYQFAFAGSVAVLHYSHMKGWRKWLQAHGAQIFLVALGVALKFIGDWLWHRFQHP